MGVFEVLAVLAVLGVGYEAIRNITTHPFAVNTAGAIPRIPAAAGGASSGGGGGTSSAVGWNGLDPATKALFTATYGANAQHCWEIETSTGQGNCGASGIGPIPSIPYQFFVDQLGLGTTTISNLEPDPFISFTNPPDQGVDSNFA